MRSVGFIDTDDLIGALTVVFAAHANLGAETHLFGKGRVVLDDLR